MMFGSCQENALIIQKKFKWLLAFSCVLTFLCECNSAQKDHPDSFKTSPSKSKNVVLENDPAETAEQDNSRVDTIEEICISPQQDMIVGVGFSRRVILITHQNGIFSSSSIILSKEKRSYPHCLFADSSLLIGESQGRLLAGSP